jgi:hypothetical protein
MEQFAFIIVYKDKEEYKSQPTLALSYQDAQDTFIFERMDKTLSIESILSYQDIKNIIETIKSIDENSKMIENKANFLTEVKKHHKEHLGINKYFSKEQLLKSFQSLEQLFYLPQEQYIVSEKLDVQWK